MKILLKILNLIVLVIILTSCSSKIKLNKEELKIIEKRLSWFGEKSPYSNKVWVYGVGSSWVKAYRDAQKMLLLKGTILVKSKVVKKGSESTYFLHKGYNHTVVEKEYINEIPKDKYYKCEETKLYTSEFTKKVYLKMECLINSKYLYK